MSLLEARNSRFAVAVAPNIFLWGGHDSKCSRNLHLDGVPKSGNSGQGCTPAQSANKLISGTLLALMPQFVIERQIPGAGSMSEAQIREMSLRSLETLHSLGPQIQWLHSYVTEDKVYCVYLAPDENTIREHARRTGIPADRVSAVRRLIDPVNFS